MIQNIYFFTGEEKYLLNKEIKRWKDTFVSKFSADSVFSFGSGNFDMPAFRQTISEGGLFFSKKLVFVYGLPLDTDQTNKLNADINEGFVDYFMKNPNISQDVLLIFVSYMPDKRTKLFKYLSENANVKKFDKLNSAKLKEFILELLPNIKFAEDALDYFTFKVGSDLYRISSEAEKILMYMKSNYLTMLDKKTIDEVTFGMVETNAFLFMDYILQSPKKIIDFGNGGYVAANLDTFQGLNHQEVAMNIIRHLNGQFVCIYLDKFQGLDYQEIALKIIENQRGEYVALYLNKFQGLNHQEIAMKLFEHGKGRTIAQNLDKFEGLNEETIQNAIKNWEEESLKNLLKSDNKKTAKKPTIKQETTWEYIKSHPILFAAIVS